MSINCVSNLTIWGPESQKMAIAVGTIAGSTVITGIALMILQATPVGGMALLITGGVLTAGDVIYILAIAQNKPKPTDQKPNLVTARELSDSNNNEIENAPLHKLYEKWESIKDKRNYYAKNELSEIFNSEELALIYKINDNPDNKNRIDFEKQISSEALEPLLLFAKLSEYMQILQTQKIQ